MMALDKTDRFLFHFNPQHSSNLFDRPLACTGYGINSTNHGALILFLPCSVALFAIGIYNY